MCFAHFRVPRSKLVYLPEIAEGEIDDDDTEEDKRVRKVRAVLCIGPLRITPLSLLSGPPNQST